MKGKFLIIINNHLFLFHVCKKKFFFIFWYKFIFIPWISCNIYFYSFKFKSSLISSSFKSICTIILMSFHYIIRIFLVLLIFMTSLKMLLLPTISRAYSCFNSSRLSFSWLYFLLVMWLFQFFFKILLLTLAKINFFLIIHLFHSFFDFSISLVKMYFILFRRVLATSF